MLLADEEGGGEHASGQRVPFPYTCSARVGGVEALPAVMPRYEHERERWRAVCPPGHFISYVFHWRRVVVDTGFSMNRCLVGRSFKADGRIRSEQLPPTPRTQLFLVIYR